jgi:hypothetical protein
MCTAIVWSLYVYVNIFLIRILPLRKFEWNKLKIVLILGILFCVGEILTRIALIYGEASHVAEPRFEPRADLAAAGRAVKNLVPEKGMRSELQFIFK